MRFARSDMLAVVGFATFGTADAFSFKPVLHSYGTQADADRTATAAASADDLALLDPETVQFICLQSAVAALQTQCNFVANAAIARGSDTIPPVVSSFLFKCKEWIVRWLQASEAWRAAIRQEMEVQFSELTNYYIFLEMNRLTETYFEKQMRDALQWLSYLTGTLDLEIADAEVVGLLLRAERLRWAGMAASFDFSHDDAAAFKDALPAVYVAIGEDGAEGSFSRTFRGFDLGTAVADFKAPVENLRTALDSVDQIVQKAVADTETKVRRNWRAQQEQQQAFLAQQQQQQAFLAQHQAILAQQQRLQWQQWQQSSAQVHALRMAGEAQRQAQFEQRMDGSDLDADPGLSYIKALVRAGTDSWTLEKLKALDVSAIQDFITNLVNTRLARLEKVVKKNASIRTGTMYDTWVAGLHSAYRVFVEGQTSRAGYLPAYRDMQAGSAIYGPMRTQFEKIRQQLVNVMKYYDGLDGIAKAYHIQW